MALTWPYSMDLYTGSMTHTPASVTQGASAHARLWLAPSARAAAQTLMPTHTGVARTRSAWMLRSSSQVSGMKAQAAKGG